MGRPGPCNLGPNEIAPAACTPKAPRVIDSSSDFNTTSFKLRWSMFHSAQQSWVIRLVQRQSQWHRNGATCTTKAPMKIDTCSEPRAAGFELSWPNGWGFFAFEHTLMSLLHEVQWQSRTTRALNIGSKVRGKGHIFHLSHACRLSYSDAMVLHKVTSIRPRFQMVVRDFVPTAFLIILISHKVYADNESHPPNHFENSL